MFHVKAFWFKKSNIWQVIYVLIILYAVSSINVLMLLASLFPYVRAYVGRPTFIKTHILIIFAGIAFLLVAAVGIHHLVIMFRKRKRKTDVQDGVKKAGFKETSFKEIWMRSNVVTRILLVLLIIYSLISVFVLIWALDIIQLDRSIEGDSVWIGFGILSFALSAIISAFHLSTMMHRRKRHSDRLEDKKAA
ncbi:MAG: hypothetical protein LBH44_07070 [Treponema sp.]|jgi:hypothetical protein|nr:hypothetical protein [Treponema sp.]